MLTFTDPDALGGTGSTTTNLTTALQILLPGEKARPHRHTMNALRFVIEGTGASTIVDGKDCPMEEGDLVITPGWTWHEHVHRGDAPIIWLDALDAPLHRYLGTDKFEPGPVHDLPNVPDDSAFAVPQHRAGAERAARRRSRRCSAIRGRTRVNAVRAAPKWKDGTRRVRYVNPITGGSTMPLMDCYLDPDRQGHRDRALPHHQQRGVPGLRRPRHHQASARTRSPGRSKDVFSLPHGNWITHKADETATLFLVTDRDALRRLDLLKEQYGNEF